MISPKALRKILDKRKVGEDVIIATPTDVGLFEFLVVEGEKIKLPMAGAPTLGAWLEQKRTQFRRSPPWFRARYEAMELAQ